MTAGDKGVQLQITLSALGYTVQPGSTGSLYAWPGSPWPPRPPVLTLPGVTYSANGQIAYYTTTGNDFTQGGEWNVQVNVEPPGGGQSFTTPPVSFYVNHNGILGT